MDAILLVTIYWCGLALFAGLLVGFFTGFLVGTLRERGRKAIKAMPPDEPDNTNLFAPVGLPDDE